MDGSARSRAAARSAAREMTALPSVEILPPGCRPTEPGWYVCTDGAVRHICEVIREGDELWAYVVGNEVGGSLHTDDIWLARIYPDRIGQE